MEESLVRRINRRVVWGSRGFTDGKTYFSVRDINYSLKDFQKKNGFRIKPAFTLYSSDSDTSDTSSDIAKGSDTNSDTAKGSDTSSDTAKGSEGTSDSVTTEEDNFTKKEKCPICGKKYSDLTRHRNRVHSQVKFRCPKCQKTYSRIDSLSRHRESHHGNERALGQNANKTR
jgi:endogenous inhibitor of DNA gyrase (YacG/DUF329 family)